MGTNDLIQYLCAADRMNPGVRPYYQDYHPALFRLLDILSQTFQAAGKPLSICGELGSDPLAIPALVGLGIRKLSMGAAAIAGAKRVIRNLDLPQAQALAQDILSMKTAGAVQARLTAFSNAHQ